MDRQWAESWAVQKWPLHPHQTCKNTAETDAEVAEAAGEVGGATTRWAEHSLEVSKWGNDLGDFFQPVNASF